MGINQVFISGTINQNPMISETKTGRKYCSFKVTVRNVSGKDKNGQPNIYTVNVNCKVWGEEANKFMSEVNKGDKIIVQGELSSFSKVSNGVEYITNEVNAKRFEILKNADSEEVELNNELMQNLDNVIAPRQQYQQPQQQPADEFESYQSTYVFKDDDLPF